MKTKLQNCAKCGEETLHDVGRKEAHKGTNHYIRRTTARCRECGTKLVANRKTGKRIIPGQNETATINKASQGENNG